MKAQYVTDDGKVFDNRVDAIRHENDISYGLTVEQIDKAIEQMARHRAIPVAKKLDMRASAVKALSDIGLLVNEKGDVEV